MQTQVSLPHKNNLILKSIYMHADRNAFLTGLLGASDLVEVVLAVLVDPVNKAK